MPDPHNAASSGRLPDERWLYSQTSIQNGDFLWRFSSERAVMVRSERYEQEEERRKEKIA